MLIYRRGGMGLVGGVVVMRLCLRKLDLGLYRYVMAIAVYLFLFFTHLSFQRLSIASLYLFNPPSVSTLPLFSIFTPTLV